MLSNPLPQSIAVPARVPVFLTKLLNDVSQSPCAAKIKRLSDVMQGLLSNAELIQLLPNDLMESFQREGSKILRNLNDPLGTLLSLATFIRIRKLWKPRDSTQKQPQWLANICQIFGAKSSNKTLDLVIISAVMTCSTSSNGYTPEERTMLVRLAIEICHEIDEDLKKTWLSANSSKLAKLCEKLKRPDIDAELQVTGLILLITFSQWLALPQEVYQSMRGQLFAQTTYNIMHAIPETVRDILLERLALHCEKEYLDFCLTGINGLQPTNAVLSKSLTNIKIDQLLVSTLRKSKQGSNIRRSFVKTLSESQVSMGILHDYAQDFSTRNESSHCSGSHVCCTATLSGTDELFLELLNCIYSSITTDGVESRQISSCYHGLLDSFLKPLKKNAATSTPCLFSQLKQPERNSVFPHKPGKLRAIEDIDGTSHEWRSKIANLLMENAKNSHETIIQQMEAMLQDFENRCSNVEAPLAAAVREREELKQQLESTNRLNQQLEEQIRQSAELVSSLRKQLDESVAQVRDYSFQVVHLTDQVDALQTELDTARKEAQDGVEMVHSKARNRELDLMATVAERDDLLEEQQMEIDAMSKERAQLQEAIHNSEERHQVVSREYNDLRRNIEQLQKDAAQDCDVLRHEITKLQQVMEIRESTNAEKDNRIMTLGETNKDLYNENQMLKDRLEQARTNCEKSMTAHEDARQKFKSSIAEMVTKCNEQVAEAQKKVFSTLRHEMANTSAKAEKELRTKEKRIQYLEKKVESLRNERAAKAREFSEAQEHISRLMSVMGFDNSKKRAAAGPKAKEGVRRSTRLSVLQAQSCPPSQVDLTTMQSQYSNPAIPPSTESFFGQNTRTTTRRHSQRLSGATSFANDDITCYFSGPQRGSIEGGGRRQPLGDLDRNNPSKSPHSSNPKNSGHDKLGQDTQMGSQTHINITDLGDLDLNFDDEELLTSTMAR
ncbi:conserved hypothetical protein [Talaromyces stipitatus ATCC 10500]|uniref:Uncharacterized protein n=1 Tax=Talaromyces stipitatus (strain ATCC 10500 / CBS 375.48 / QM 6759 / NRRL 1006) TaxID=441959 RepID=B8MMS7_TALSN|nr:uncharacterized protein TSTA_100750 [Talaromyces stipitatus ATCC 10500]EED13833.1 conserved hypothetical protein [Talaromyces stipitatus ATCC 10500]